MSGEHRFTSAHSALETFKRGSRGPRWEAAGEYLMRNANPDTRMLLEFAIERTRKEMGGGAAPKKARKLHPAWFVAAVIGATALLGAFAWLFITIAGNLKCT